MIHVCCPYCGGQLDGRQLMTTAYAHKPIKKRKKKWYRRYGLFYALHWMFWWIMWGILWLFLLMYLALIAIGETFFHEDKRQPRYALTKSKAHQYWEYFPPYNQIKKTQTRIYCTVCGHEFG